ncbi:MAG TPA: DsbE family thiol:disulfide interchange protein [Gammaproteobacteria bacterium]|nr:DsbE family thiol:disulfide interchange protein [Gammaproteobacteria bacterium]
MWRYLIPVGVLAALVVALWFGLYRDPRLVPSPLIDKPAPSFALPGLYKPEHTFTESIFKGQVSLLNVWGTWCVGCRIEHNTWLAFVQNSNIPVIGLNWRDKRAEAINWLKEGGDPYSVVLYDPNSKTTIDYGVYGAPETFLIDAQGIIRYKHIGPMTPDVLYGEIMPLVKQLQGKQ